MLTRFLSVYLFNEFVHVSVIYLVSSLELGTFGIIADLDCYPHRSSCLGVKVEPRGFGCQAFIGFLVLELFILVSLFSPTFVINRKFA